MKSKHLITTIIYIPIYIKYILNSKCQRNNDQISRMYKRSIPSGFKEYTCDKLKYLPDISKQKREKLMIMKGILGQNLELLEIPDISNKLEH